MKKNNPNGLANNKKESNFSRRHILKTMGVVGLGVAIGGLSGCAEKKLKESYAEKEKRKYQESINQILISQDGKYIAVLCDKYHYLMEADVNLLKAIQSPLHEKMIAKFSEFSVLEHGYTDGSLELTVPESQETEITEEELSFAKLELGFSVHAYKTKIYATRSFKVEGFRYDAGGFKLPETIKKLNRVYTIQVVEKIPLSDEDQQKKNALTPISKVADGAMVIIFGTGALLLLPAWGLIDSLERATR